LGLKSQEKSIQKIKKDLESHTTQPQLAEALAFINSLIEIDPSLAKPAPHKNYKK
jgi:hypothetical protein